jgi:hypothetical protein
MAVRWAVINGNWSDTATWNDGTLPAVDDDVHADGKTVTIDQDVTVLSIRNDQRSGGTNGGTFTANAGITINSSIIRGNLSNCLLFTILGTININGNVSVTTEASTVVHAITNSGGGTVNIVGNISSPDGNLRRVGAILNSLGTVNIVGNIQHLSYRPSPAILISNQSTMNITGNIRSDITSSIGAAGVSAIDNNGTLNIFGSVFSTVGTANCTILNSGYLNFDGVINSLYSSFSRPAIESLTSTTAINIIKGDINCSPYGDFPLAVRRLYYVPSTGTTFTFADNSTNGQLPPAAAPGTFTLYSPDILIDAPVATDVRQGVVYADGVLTGTLAVPSPSNVRKDIPTDNTVGTADLSAAEFWTYVTRTLTENPTIPTVEEISDQVWLDEPDRLKITSTVQMTGAQLQAYLDN